LVDNTALNFGFGIHTGDSFAESSQVICTGNQDVVQTPVVQICEHTQPEVGSFTFGDIGTQHLFAALRVDAQDIV